MWGTATLLFLTFFVLPGDREDRVLTGDRIVAPEVRANVAHQLGLDQPLLTQYGRYWERLLHGDLGTSFVNSRPVGDILAQAAPASARLTFWAVVLEVLLGVTAGVIVARRNSAFLRTLTAVSTAVLLAVPAFVIGSILQVALGVEPSRRGWSSLPVQGIGPNHWMFGVVPVGSQWKYVLLPAVTLAAASTAVLTRVVQASVRSTLDADFVRGARAKGVPEHRILRRHVLPLAAVPAITFVGVDLATMFGSAVITETVFNWPGMGGELARAVRASDAPTLMGLTMVLALVYVVTTIVVDVVHGILDPRVASSS